MTETTPPPAKQALAARLNNPNKTLPSTKELIVADAAGLATLERARQALVDWKENKIKDNPAVTPEEQVVMDALAAERQQKILEQRKKVLDAHNESRPPGEQLPNFNPPKPVDTSVPPAK